MCPELDREPLVRENGQPVDRNSSRDRLFPRQTYITTVIVIAVPGHIDRAPLGVERSVRKLGQGEIDTAADGRAASKRTRNFQQLIAELLGAVQVSNQSPADQQALSVRAGPFDEADGNLPMQSRGNCVDDVGVTKSGSASLPLQLELIRINAARDIGGEYQQKIDQFFRLNVCVPPR